MTHLISVPAIAMRKAPDSNAEVVSEAFLSEEVTVLEKAGDWHKIETTVDHYPGWVPSEAICRSVLFHENFVTVSRLSAHLYSVEDTIYGPLMTVPYESKLHVTSGTKESEERWIQVSLPTGNKAYVQRGDVVWGALPEIQKKDLATYCIRFLNLPYTWGGRSSFGYDCSGFVQMLYRRMGILIPRDARDQIVSEKFSRCDLEKTTLGDLIFFGKDEKKIRHVGLALGQKTFIHATVAENAPYIRISRLDDLEWCGRGTYPYVAACTQRNL